MIVNFVPNRSLTIPESADEIRAAPNVSKGIVNKSKCKLNTLNIQSKPTPQIKLPPLAVIFFRIFFINIKTIKFKKFLKIIYQVKQLIFVESIPSSLIDF